MDKTVKKAPDADSRLRPYEKFRRFGVESLTEAELLVVILRCGTKKKDAESLAARILSLSPTGKDNLLGLHHLSMEQLLAINGVGEVKATQIKCVMEFCSRVAKAKAHEELAFDRSGTVASYYMESMRHRTRECVLLLCLDAKGQLIREKKLSDGSVNMALISPREIFLEALKDKAVSLILVHNHPSGDPTPSRSDRELTENVAKVGNQMDIPLLDHIIIGDNRYTSFREQKFLI